MVLKFCLFLALIGHIICGITDCLMTYTPNGKFQFSDMKDSGKMSKIFEGMIVYCPCIYETSSERQYCRCDNVFGTVSCNIIKDIWSA